jgi:folate-dependent phosphoribosylglycinamide formyltransferase PurN
MKAKSQRRVAVFASGSGTTFRATADAIRQGIVDFAICLVITDREDAGVIKQVEEVNRLHGSNIAVEIINQKRYPGGARGRGQTDEEATAMCAALQQAKIDHLCLMGGLRIIGQEVVDRYGWRPNYGKQDPQHGGIYLARMSNTHPGILPATRETFGLGTQQRALELGLTETAHTLHLVAAGLDDGPIIAQHPVKIFRSADYPGDQADTPEKLFDRVQRIEKANLPLDIEAFLKEQARFQAQIA